MGPSLPVADSPRSLTGSGSSKPGQHGFTLIELVMTMMLIGILSSIAYYRLNPSGFFVRAAADDLITAIRHAQGRAMNHSGIHLYTVQISGNGYSILKDGNPITDPMTGVPGFSQVFSGVTVSPTATFNFDGSGRPNLSTALLLTLSSGDAQALIRIEPETGFTR